VTKLTAAGDNLVYSTYFGGTDNDWIDPEESYGIAVDRLGCAYVTGSTECVDFPVRNPFQASLRGLCDVFVTKFSAAGNDLVYSTYLGGTSYKDWPGGIAVDGNGCAYVTGYTESIDFPTRNAFQPTKDYWEMPAFVTKFSTEGDLVYSTFLGGGREWDTHIAVDNSGCAYVTGTTVSYDFHSNPFQAPKGHRYFCDQATAEGMTSSTLRT
jgi:hypothetical protein